MASLGPCHPPKVREPWKTSRKIGEQVPPGRGFLSCIPTLGRRKKTCKEIDMTRSVLATLLATSMALPAAAQMLGPDYGTDYDRDTFNTGFMETGYYDAIDTDDDELISTNEYSTGLYADYDMDGNSEISDTEFENATDRYMGAGAYDANTFGTYDADGSGYLDQQEFGSYYGDNMTQYYSGMDTDQSGYLDYNEYSTGLYDAADVNQDRVISIEEEGWFEGWFDGDDIEAEIETVGEVY
jgi:hypothetical protein